MDTSPFSQAVRLGNDAFYRGFCETLGVALIATDQELQIRLWNTAASRMFGAAAPTMIGTPLSHVVPQDRRRIAERIFRRALETGETIQFEFQHRDEQGDRRELAATVAPMVDESAMRIGVSVCVRDITRRMALQAELLEGRKMIALGEMAGAIAHHFNNILGGMVTSIDFAISSGDPDIQSRALQQVGAALTRATTLVNGLLAFAEGDQRADDLADFTELINELADEFEPQARASNVRFEMTLPKLPVIPFPRVQLLTILRNIIRNALEAMPKGGTLRLDVSTGEQEVVMLIEDTGMGLDEASKSRIFEPFWTTKGLASSPGGRAVGLGLAITHGLVQMLGGTIMVTSQQGKGSCFRVTLPLPQEA